MIRDFLVTLVYSSWRSRLRRSAILLFIAFWSGLVVLQDRKSTSVYQFLFVLVLVADILGFEPRTIFLVGDRHVFACLLLPFVVIRELIK